jgi:hypothetical protein
VVSASSANNVIGNNAGSGGLTSGTNGNQVLSDNNVGLAALASNGGTTQTIALVPGSPAIGAGRSSFAGTTVVAPATDERGGVRPTSGSIDVGAYQSGAAVFVPLIITPVAPLAFIPTARVTISTAQPLITAVTVPIVSPSSANAVSPPVVKVAKATKKAAVAKKAHPNGNAASKFHKLVHAPKAKKTPIHKAASKPAHHTAVAKPQANHHLPKK